MKKGTIAMRTIRLLAPSRLEMRETDERPAITDSTVRVDIKACGICGSDLALYNGRRDLSGEHYFGHEFSGVITEVGNGANGLKKGMRVASELVKGCGRCWFCRNGMQNYCKSLNDALLPGGFTEQTLVTNTDAYSFLSPIPDELDDITASILEPANCAYHVAMKANIQPGDSVLVIGNEDKAEYWTGDQAAPYLEAYEENMQSFGYTRVATKAEAALGLQISYVQSTQYFVGYSYPYWWDSYPGYWGPGYWGNWGYWYYPYNIVYSYHVGSLLTEMVDLRVPQGQEKKLTVVWNSFMSGLLTGSNTINTALAVQAIDQSFVQSPYLNITSLAQ